MPNSTKIIVTNRSALLAKYQPAGFKRILAAVRTLVAADKHRQFATRLIFLDDASQLKRDAVTDPKSGQQHKVAIDRVYATFRPDYLVILGAQDVVPHVSLSNPAGNDGDQEVPSDLPYACEAELTGRDPRLFTSVTRVVGRIPDICGETTPTFLVKQLNVAARFRSRRRDDYMAYFALSAAIWQKSTDKSVKAIFNSANVRLSPPAKNVKAKRDLGPRMHYINCHGGKFDSNFYGQRNPSSPVAPIALTTQGVARNASAQTVVAAECCYGAYLYEIDEAPELPIAISYLDRGAIGFFGSTTIAYGDSARNSAADLITRFFMINVLAGASLGRACLQARQTFVDQEDLDVYNLKTVAQFILLGDPSLHPCRIDDRDERMIAEVAEGPAARRLRRTDLAALGRSVGLSSTYFGTPVKRPGQAVTAQLRKVARQLGITGGNVSAFETSGGDVYKASLRARGKPRVVVLSKVIQPRGDQRARAGKAQAPPDVRAVVARVYGSRIARVSYYASR